MRPQGLTLPTAGTISSTTCALRDRNRVTSYNTWCRVRSSFSSKLGLRGCACTSSRGTNALLLSSERSGEQLLLPASQLCDSSNSSSRLCLRSSRSRALQLRLQLKQRSYQPSRLYLHSSSGATSARASTARAATIEFFSFSRPLLALPASSSGASLALFLRRSGTRLASPVARHSTSDFCRSRTETPV